MKRNSKKLVVFVIIAVITMFSVSAMAWDDDHLWKHFRGKYAGSTVGSCIATAENGFNPDFTVKDMTQTRFNSYSEQDIWTFKADGTGTVEGTRVLLNFGPGPYSTPEADGSAVTYSYNIQYDLKHDGTITTELIPGTFEGKIKQGGPPIPNLTFTFGPISDSGMVSEDHKTITLGTVKVEVATANVLNGAILSDNVCTGGRVLIRVGE
jgi:hypothetical protein